MTETSGYTTVAKRKEIEDEMEKVSSELKELSETNKILSERLQILSSEKPTENGLQICPVCHCERKSNTHFQALKCRIHVLKENEKKRQQEIGVFNKTFKDLASKFDSLITRAKPHTQASNELKDTKTGIFLSNSAADGDSKGLSDGYNATSSPSNGQTIVDTSSLFSVETYSKSSAMKNSSNSYTGPKITCYGDENDSADEDEDGDVNGYQKPKILPYANENKSSRLTISNPNFGARKGQRKFVQGRDYEETHKTEDICPELIPKQTGTILVPGIPAQYWRELAKAEADAAPKGKVGKISTVFCLDISSSMAECRAWYQATTFIRQFIAGMKHSLEEHNIDEESVALCVFGHKVKVVQQLTISFSLLTTALDCLKVGGPSPLYGGLLMSSGLIDCSSCQANDIKIFPRIILISDGKPSSNKCLAGPDNASSAQGEEESEILEVVKNIADKEIQLHCVPVGNANQAFLEKIATLSHGKVFPYTAGRKVAKKLANTLHAGFVLRHLEQFDSLPKSKDLDENTPFSKIVKSSNFAARMLIEYFLETICNSKEEQEEVYTIAKEAMKEGLFVHEESNSGYEKYHMEILDVNLPPVGSRVRRGPNWDKENQDDNGPGTVVGHRLGRKVYVNWDANGTINKYRYGEDGEYDVMVVDEPRELKHDELIAVGCLVKRGPDWRYGDQDGTPGAKGVVLRVVQDGRVIIRWPDRSKAYYRFGAGGCFDLEICSPKFGGQGHTLRNPASAAYSIAPRFEGQGYTLGGSSSASGNQSSQNVGNRNKNLTNSSSRVKTLFS